MSDPDYGPDSFGGDDAESHYAAPAMWKETRALLEQGSRRLEVDEHDPRLAADALEGARPLGVREHDLKLAADLFEEVQSGRKTFELRRNDRNFQVDDILWLHAWDGVAYDGRTLQVKVTYLIDGERFGALQPGFVCMSIKPVV